MTATLPRPEDIQASFCAVIVDQWANDGVTHAFVAPGSRSTPLALALAEEPRIRVEIVHDERSAAFMALGAGLATGVPAITLCTSGTAAAHFHAAIVEADLSGVPLIACTADRPPELQGIRAPQTINQKDLYGDSVRKFIDPGVPEWNERGQWRNFARQAFDAATGFGRGPVHVNLPFREPLVGAPTDAIHAIEDSVAARDAVRPTKTDVAMLVEHISGLRGVIVAGHGCRGLKQVVELAERLNWPVLADSRSGLQHHDGVITHADAFLREPNTSKRLKPEVVLQLGEGPASKVLGQYLHDGAAKVIQISDRPENRDPFRDVAIALHGDLKKIVVALLREVQNLNPVANEFKEAWITADRLAAGVITECLGSSLTEPAVANTVAESARAGQIIVASSSMPIRDLEWYSRIGKGVTVLSNRGANGIDGVLATAIGAAATTKKTVYVLIGDVAFLHDSSSLTALNKRDVNMRIVVTDNDGGAIFSFLSQKQTLKAERYEQLFGTPHGTDLIKMAKAHGLKSVGVNTRDALKRALAGRGVKVIVVKTNRDSNLEEHNRINSAVSQRLSSQ
jgi:2-succinyl-5-enolpyruvyl-6-hydroxy-3-cyclohexene-1-carboxylate synthase